MMKTKSGQFVVFHQEVCPFARAGAKIPQDYENEAGSWFFTRQDGNPTALGDLRGYPMIYSPGFLTEREALEAAEAWEIEKVQADRSYRAGMNVLDALLDETDDHADDGYDEGLSTDTFVALSNMDEDK